MGVALSILGQEVARNSLAYDSILNKNKVVGSATGHMQPVDTLIGQERWRTGELE